MPFWRRRKPLHEQLAEGTGLLEWRPRHEPVLPGFRTTLDFLHGARPRRWDAVVTAEAPALTGDEVHFVAFEEGRLLVDEVVPDASLEPLANAVDDALGRPYRAHARRQHERVWAVAANMIEVVPLPGMLGERVELSMHAGERTLTIDDEPSLEAAPALEGYARRRHGDYVARAQRLDGDLWEVQVTPL